MGNKEVKGIRFIRKKTPGGRNVVHRTRKLGGKAQCAMCKKMLHGVPRGRRAQIRKLAKSKRTPNRPYAGQLCSKCSLKVQVIKARLKVGIIKDHEVPISMRRYL